MKAHKYYLYKELSKQSKQVALSYFLERLKKRSEIGEINNDALTRFVVNEIIEQNVLFYKSGELV